MLIGMVEFLDEVLPHSHFLFSFSPLLPPLLIISPLSSSPLLFSLLLSSPSPSLQSATLFLLSSSFSQEMMKATNLHYKFTYAEKPTLYFEFSGNSQQALEEQVLLFLLLLPSSPTSSLSSYHILSHHPSLLPRLLISS